MASKKRKGVKFVLMSSEEMSEEERRRADAEVASVKKASEEWGSKPNPPFLVQLFREAEKLHKEPKQKRLQEGLDQIPRG